MGIFHLPANTTNVLSRYTMRVIWFYRPSSSYVRSYVVVYRPYRPSVRTVPSYVRSSSSVRRRSLRTYDDERRRTTYASYRRTVVPYVPDDERRRTTYASYRRTVVPSTGRYRAGRGRGPGRGSVGRFVNVFFVLVHVVGGGTAEDDGTR